MLVSPNRLFKTELHLLKMNQQSNSQTQSRSRIHDHCVLVLNRNWQAISVISPADAFSHIVSGSADGLEIDGDHNMAPIAWNAWMKLSIRDRDHSIGTPHGAVRIPTIIILKHFNKVPLFRPKFGLKALWLRDGGMCQYSGKTLNLAEASIDHVMPQSRGGETSWENCVLCERLLNSQKGDKTPAEAGLKLRKTPREPKAVLVTLTLKNALGIKDWQFFLLTKAA
jgi:5-methylcytosine-specific restriction endonuclease McrA